MNEQEIKNIWIEFKDYAIQKHHLLPDYEPDFSSILLWEEYKQRKLSSYHDVIEFYKE